MSMCGMRELCCHPLKSDTYGGMVAYLVCVLVYSRSSMSVADLISSSVSQGIIRGLFWVSEQKHPKDLEPSKW